MEGHEREPDGRAPRRPERRGQNLEPRGDGATNEATRRFARMASRTPASTPPRSGVALRIAVAV